MYIVKFLRKPILKNICKRLLLHWLLVIFVSATYGVDALKSIRYYHKIQPCFIMMSGKSAWTNKIHGQMCIMKIQNARVASIFENINYLVTILELLFSFTPFWVYCFFNVGEWMVSVISKIPTWCGG